MNIEPTTKANKIAIFILLVAAITYHVVLGMSSIGGNRSLFHSGVKFSTNAIRNTIEPSVNNSFSPFDK